MIDTKSLLEERKQTHSKFEEHARCTQRMMHAMMQERNWYELSPEYREALHMIAHKMARICTGNPSHADHVDDIIGYAMLMRQYLDTSPVAIKTEPSVYKDVVRNAQREYNTEHINDRNT